jgi:hypothetical protein
MDVANIERNGGRTSKPVNCGYVAGSRHVAGPAKQKLSVKFAFEIDHPVRHIRSVSVAEVKRAIDEFSEDDRLEVAAHLHRVMRDNDPDWPAELARRLDDCIAGKGYGIEDLQKIHQKLCDEGR